MIKNKLFFAVTILLTLVFLSTPVFAQEMDEDEVQNLLEEEDDSLKSPVDVNLQKNFIIVESVRQHNLNPHTTSMSSDSQILEGLYEGLFTYNPVTLDPQYAIAKDYKISRDKKRVTFILREDAYFSNGEKITAESVRLSWLQLLSTPNAPYASLLDIIRGAEDFRWGKISEDEVGIKVVSENQLSVYLNAPANYLPRVLCHPTFAIIHRNPTVYSGAFYLYDEEPGLLVMKKNPYYWDCANTHLEQITFVQSDDADENTFLFNTGAVDWITNSFTSDKLLDTSAVQFNATFGTAYFFFKQSSRKAGRNQADFDPWDYEEFRAAILEAFPWGSVRKEFFVPSTTFVYPLSGYPEVEGYDYSDSIEAVNKMKKAREKYGIPEDEIIPLTIEVNEYTMSDEKLQSIKDALQPLGVDFLINKVPVNTYFSGIATSSSDMFAYSWIGDFADPLTFLCLFQGTSTLNDSGWVNADYDALLAKAAEASSADRYAYLAQAETLLLDSCMILPLYHPVSWNVIDTKEVGGWSTNAIDLHPLKYLYKKAEPSKVQNVVILK